ncbi:MAG: hypothetical protein KAI72_01880, partial [Candidatus Pacebacteria bacterium]|nr:hypothetical protein [Candidatus Paceibacterota bacterium]
MVELSCVPAFSGVNFLFCSTTSPQSIADRRRQVGKIQLEHPYYTPLQSFIPRYPKSTFYRQIFPIEQKTLAEKKTPSKLSVLRKYFRYLVKTREIFLDPTIDIKLPKSRDYLP